MNDFFRKIVATTENAWREKAAANKIINEREWRYAIDRADKNIEEMAKEGSTCCTTFIHPSLVDRRDEFIKHYTDQGFHICNRKPIAEGSTSYYYEISWGIQK